QADRTVLVVLRHQITAEPIIDHSRACPDCAGLSKKLTDESLSALRAICQAETRREIQITRLPPGRRSIRRPIQITAQDGVGHCILRHALAMKIIASGEVFAQRDRWRDLSSALFIQRPEVFIANTEIERQLASCSIDVSDIRAVVALDK